MMTPGLRTDAFRKISATSVPLAENIIEKEFDATGLAAAVHEFAIILKKAVGSTEETKVHGNQYIPRMRRFTQWMKRVIFVTPFFRVLPCLPWIFKCGFRIMGHNSRGDGEQSDPAGVTL